MINVVERPDKIKHVKIFGNSSQIGPTLVYPEQ